MSSNSARVVFVTGASRGIGAATACAFGRAGWRVAIGARTRSGGERLPHQLRRPDGALPAGSLEDTAAAVRATGAQVFSHAMDLMDTASLDAALAHFGRIDLLINNAAYQDRESNAMLAALDGSLTDAAQHATLIVRTGYARRAPRDEHRVPDQARFFCIRRFL